MAAGELLTRNDDEWGARIKGCVKREATYLSLRSQTSEPG